MNIWQIQEELFSIFNEIEDNCGEITPELEDKLQITQENFKNKITSYINLIKYKESNIEAIDKEINRLNIIKASKNKAINKIKSVVIKAINNFGNTTKTGTKFYEYDTGRISIRRSKSVDINTDDINNTITNLKILITFLRNNNQLRTINEIDKNDFIYSLQCVPDGEDGPTNSFISEEDLKNIKTKISYNISLYDLLSEKGYELLKEIALENNFNIAADISKLDIKKYLTENSNNQLNIAKFVETESLIIK